MTENKRWRPSVTEYRKLEMENEELKMKVNVDGCYDKVLEEERDEWKRKFEEQLEGTSTLVRDCNEWREKYRGLKKEYDKLRSDYAGVVEECEIQRKNSQENYEELQELKSRGFWARILNKGV